MNSSLSQLDHDMSAEIYISTGGVPNNLSASGMLMLLAAYSKIIMHVQGDH